MKEAEGAGPRSILPSSRAQTTASGASASDPVASASTLAASIPPVPPSGSAKARKKPSKKWKQKVSEAFAEKATLGVDSVWEHEVNPIDREFPADYNFRAALDTGLTNGPIWEILGPLVPEQLLGTAQYLACKLTACLQLCAFYVGVENAFAAKVQMEKDLAAIGDQVDVLTAERDFAMAAPLLHAKMKSLSQELDLAEGERLSALDTMKEVEERAKVQAAELESCRSALEQERKKVESLTQSLKGKQMALDEVEAAAVRHLNLAIDYSMITLETRWDPKAKGFIILRLRPKSSQSLRWWTGQSLWPKNSRMSYRSSKWRRSWREKVGDAPFESVNC
ncbi:hypothetical protein PIB30_077733 [Stylosanthes scabra]|uniref:Uncharacterized protein n=1 Tax=Stylosanthes scabra TaxID=79078 RepID=A0ABU6QR31_9FABA|nr:hypothetical protein [Stylosanthes scabra]